MTNCEGSKGGQEDRRKRMPLNNTHGYADHGVTDLPPILARVSNGMGIVCRSGSFLSFVFTLWNRDPKGGDDMGVVEELDTYHRISDFVISPEA